MNAVSNLDLSRLVALEQNPVLSKKVVGKEDVNVSAMIQHLGNSDWVRQGMKYLGHTDDDCPFCQQKLPQEFEKALKIISTKHSMPILELYRSFGILIIR